MELRIQLFAGLVDLFGTSVLTFHINREIITIGEVKQQIIACYPTSDKTLESCFFAKNQAYAGEEEKVNETDEIALIPPVSGGQSEPTALSDNQQTLADELYVITHEAIDVNVVSAKVITPNHGASIAFIGTTREFTQGQRTVLLEYSAYMPMAVKMLKLIGEEIAAKWTGALCAITHRLGTVGIGETSVVIAISAAHRAECYDASRYAIERLKQIVPIWKKEVWEDGSEWKGSQTGPWNPTVPFQPENEE
jgi:molybdopterin synthase catalytic subunit/molybdopterin converting factor small subunit